MSLSSQDSAAISFAFRKPGLLLVRLERRKQRVGFGARVGLQSWA